MFSKKGQGLPIETLIIVLLAIIVLIAIILIFSGSSGEIFSAVKEFISNIGAPKINYTDVVK